MLVGGISLPTAAILLGLAFFQPSAVVVKAQTIQAALWNVPSGSAADLAQTFQEGNTIPLSWNAYNGTTDDLWVTTWDYTVNPYSLLLKQDIDLTQGGTYSWTINIPVDQLGKSAKYCLRFKPPNNGVYDDSSPELSSPGFLIIQAVSSTTTASSSSATGSSTTTDTSSSTSGTATGSSSTGSASSTGNSGGLSAGAKAGIGIGCAIAGLILIILPAWWWWRKRRQQRAGGASQMDPAMSIPPTGPYAAGLPGDEYAYSHLGGKPVEAPVPYSPQPPQELPSHGEQAPVEMYSGNGR